MWSSCVISACNFSVNRMLTAECYKRRLEVGLTFLEFNLYADAKL
jgi:tyrosyl-tRNA synthetase